MHVSSSEVDVNIISLLLLICFALVCILCISCVILVIFAIRLLIHTKKSPLANEEERKKEFKEVKEKVKEKAKEEVKKTIKKLSDPIQGVIHSAQDHFHSAQDHLKQQTQHFKQQTIDPYIQHSSKMATHTQDLVAVSTPDANTILFQVDQNYKLCFYESLHSDETKNKKYDLNTLKVDDEPIYVSKDLPVIAAVAFTHQNCCKGEPQVRLYFVAKDGSNNVIRELQRSGGRGEEWTKGKDFNNHKYKIAIGSGLTANVFQSAQAAIKVYYQESTDDMYADVVYNIIGTNNWTNRPNVTES